MASRRIDITLLDDSLKELINASAKIFPIAAIVDLPVTHEHDYYRITSGEDRNKIYAWVEETHTYELIGADDREVDWGMEVLNKPKTFPPSEHNHDEVYQPIGNYALEVHKHSELDIIDLDKYTKQEVDDAQDTLKMLIDSELAQKLLTKVDKEVGKQLTTNDFTNELKLKLESLSESASVDYSTMNQELQTHKNETNIHVTSLEKAAIDTISGKADKNYLETELAKKANSSTLSGHTGNTTIHVTQNDKDLWNGKAEVSQIPTSTSELTNDSGFITVSEVPQSGTKVVVSPTEPSVSANDLWYKELS